MCGEGKSISELLELQNRMQKLERALMERSSLRASPQVLESQGTVGQEGKHMTCFKCGKTLLFLTLGTGGPYPPVAAVQNREQGRGDPHMTFLLYQCDTVVLNQNCGSQHLMDYILF